MNRSEAIRYAESKKGFIRWYVIHFYADKYILYSENHISRNPALLNKCVYVTQRIEAFFWNGPLRLDLPFPLPQHTRCVKDPFRHAKPLYDELQLSELSIV